MKRQYSQDRGHGTWQLEQLLRGFQAVYATLPTERQDGMSAREVDGLYFLLQELTLRLEDIFLLLVQEQVRAPRKAEDEKGGDA